MTGRLLLATTNAGKQAEFRRLLLGLPGEVVTPDELGIDLAVEEPFDSYAENATAKAVAFAHAAGLPALADDSGIEVAALAWGPGVRSARWGGGRNAERLKETLAGELDRRARMVCVLALAIPGASEPEVELFRGVIAGVIAETPRGSGGFGYDPIFELPDGRTTAELAEADKDRISHRGRAVSAALPRLRALLSSA